MEFSRTIYTIGHSTHDYVDFLQMLKAFDIEVLADVRHFPGSRKFPQFNKDFLAGQLPTDNIKYRHIEKLGGRRKASKDSLNTAWRHAAFRGYADYMETHEFKDGIDELISEASERRTVMMCSESVWWRCHRSMISDYLKADGWNVLHIMNTRDAKEHPYTAPAKINNGKLSYKITE